MLIRLALDLALHMLKKSKGALPVAPVGEFPENMRKIGQRQLVLEGVKTSGNAAEGREARKLVD
ncbi:Hypothetical predicted protein [Olea europaea subsp. europaea]|uniref:Uncharacterized protein n=1 Tax=Olea europaea subsp. europaea TaxID=158383 RepID=A0A8S0SQT4_OLEEU|nr:Hypothetical predicted protein [Olea europaea subsp. europaea]